MPRRLSLPGTLVVVALAFALAFAVSALAGGGSTAAAPAAERTTSHVAPPAPVAQPAPQLAAVSAVPALRVPLKRRARARKPARKFTQVVRPVVTAAPRSRPKSRKRTATAQPVATAAPRYVAPAPRY